MEFGPFVFACVVVSFGFILLIAGLDGIDREDYLLRIVAFPLLVVSYVISIGALTTAMVTTWYHFFSIAETCSIIGC